ncbi:MAG: ATP-binding cassette domain-containing protein [Planctomycetota bacterium]|jgi:ABC-type multidrug transport system ATPase subunit
MSNSTWQLNDTSLISGRTARLNGIGLQIGSGVTAVLGASGAGKSSLLSLLAGFEQPTSGSIAFVPKPDAGQLPLFWSPQDHGLWPKLTAREHLATVRPDAPQVDHSVDRWLAVLRLDAVADALPHRLSQGERSRLSLGRALASEAACLVLDEPLAHVDPIHCRQYLDLIADHARSLGGTVVFSTHNPAGVLRIAENVVCLSDTRCVFKGPVNELYFNPPTEEAAWLLGPANWLGDESDTLRSLIENDPPRCIRPHELVVMEAVEQSVPASEAPWLDVVAVSRAGEVSEVAVRDPSGAERQLFLLRCPADVLRGSSVRLRCECDSRR